MVCGSARRFWKHELEEAPFNFEARKQLIYAEIADGDEATAWRLIDESFETVDIHDASSLQVSAMGLYQSWGRSWRRSVACKRPDRKWK
jgi:hypothetical protein